MMQRDRATFNEEAVTYLYDKEEKLSLLIEYIEDPRGSILPPMRDHNLTDDHPKAQCPLCRFEINHAWQVIDTVQTIKGFPCLLTTVTREYAPNHKMILSVNPHPQYIFSLSALRTFLEILETSNVASQVWFNSKGAGAGIYTHFHFHLSDLHAPLWSWIDNHSPNSLKGLKNNLLKIHELNGWPARVRLYETSNKATLINRLNQDLQNLHQNNIPYTLLVRLLSKNIFQVVLCPRIWSDPHDPTVLLFPDEGPYLWYPRLGAPGVPGGAIYVVGTQTQLSSKQKSIMIQRIKQEMHKLSNWLWIPKKLEYEKQ